MKLTLSVLSERLNELIGIGSLNFSTSLTPSDCSTKLDLSERKDYKSMPGVVGGQTKEPLRARFKYVQLNEGARFQVVERQCSAPLPKNSGRQGLAFDVNWVKTQV